MDDFYKLLDQKRSENSHIEILTKSRREINEKGFSGGFCEPIFEENKLKSVRIWIDEDEPDEVMKIKVLFHELGHSKDYFKRKSELESITLDKYNFYVKSEFFAFENSLIEALELYKKGRKDILLSLLEKIPSRIDDPMYEFGVTEIMKTELWKDCVSVTNLI